MSEQKKQKENPLSVLIGQATENSNSQIKAILKAREQTDSEDQLKININLVDRNPYQPRKNFNEKKLMEFAESIKLVGQISPIVVRKTPQGRYELIAGERRWRAIKSLEWTEI